MERSADVSDFTHVIRVRAALQQWLYHAQNVMRKKPCRLITVQRACMLLSSLTLPFLKWTELSSIQQIKHAVTEFGLGLDLRTAAYACVLQKIYHVYLAAGIISP